MQALGYQQLAAVLDGNMTVEAAAAEIARVTLAYARRQRTWFKKEPSPPASPNRRHPKWCCSCWPRAPSAPAAGQPEARE